MENVDGGCGPGIDEAAAAAENWPNPYPYGRMYCAWNWFSRLDCHAKLFAFKLCPRVMLLELAISFCFRPCVIKR